MMETDGEMSVPSSISQLYDGVNSNTIKPEETEHTSEIHIELNQPLNPENASGVITTLTDAVSTDRIIEMKQNEQMESKLSSFVMENSVFSVPNSMSNEKICCSTSLHNDDEADGGIDVHTHHKNDVPMENIVTDVTSDLDPCTKGAHETNVTTSQSEIDANIPTTTFLEDIQTDVGYSSPKSSNENTEINIITDVISCDSALDTVQSRTDLGTASIVSSEVIIKNCVSLVAGYRSDSSLSTDTNYDSDSSSSSTSSFEFLRNNRSPLQPCSDDEEERPGAKPVRPRTKGELYPEDLPPLEDLCITVDEDTPLVNFGKVSSFVGVLVVIQSYPNMVPMDIESVVFSKDRTSLGVIFETFGPVIAPLYSIRFNNAEQIKEKGVEVGMEVYCAPSVPDYTHYVFLANLQRMKGSDASWEHNNEPPPKCLDYSDDEEEKRANARPNKNRKKCQDGGPDAKSVKTGGGTWPPEESSRSNSPVPKSSLKPNFSDKKCTQRSNWASSVPSSNTQYHRPMFRPETPMWNVNNQPPMPRFGAPPVFRPYGLPYMNNQQLVPPTFSPGFFNYQGAPAPPNVSCAPPSHSNISRAPLPGEPVSYAPRGPFMPPYFAGPRGPMTLMGGSTDQWRHQNRPQGQPRNPFGYYSSPTNY